MSLAKMLLKNKKLICFFGIISLGVTLRLIGINKSLSGDEIITTFAARKNISDIVPRLISDDSHPPLYYFALHYWLKVSQSEFWLRFLSLLFGVGICIICFFIGRRYYNEKIGFLSLLLLTVSPGLVWQSQYVRPYAFSSFFICFSLYFFLALIHGKFKWMNWWGYVLTSLFAMYSFYFSGLVIFGENLFMLFGCRKYKKLLWRWLSAQILITIIFYPWVSLVIAQLSKLSNQMVVFSKRGFYISSLHIGGLLRYVSGCLGIDPLFFAQEPIYGKVPNYFLHILFIFFGLCLLGALFILAIAFKKFDKDFKVNNALFLVLVTSCFIIGDFFHQFFKFGILSYHFIPCFPFLAFLFTGLILLVRSRRMRVAIFVLLITLSLARTARYHTLNPEPWRELVKSIEHKSPAATTILCFVEPYWFSYNYYARFNMQQVVLSSYFLRDQKNLNFTGVKPQLSSQLLSLLDSREQVWFVHVAHEVFKGDAVFKQWLNQQGYNEVEENAFGEQLIAARYRRT